MKKYLSIFLVLGLLLAPISTLPVLAQDGTETSVTVATEGTPSSENTTESAPAPVPEAADEEPEPMKLPFLVTFLWPFIVTALVGVVKAVSGRLQQEIPPQLWPVANAVLVAIVTGLQQSGTPQEAIMNVIAAVLIALGFVKSIDFGKGKWSTVTPDMKKKVEEAIAKGVIK